MIEADQDLKSNVQHVQVKASISGNLTLIQLTSEDSEYKASWKRKYRMTQEKDQSDKGGETKWEYRIFPCTDPLRHSLSVYFWHNDYFKKSEVERLTSFCILQL